MDAPGERVVFCTDDTVGLKDDKFTVGVIDRTFGDIETHASRPQRDYGDNIECHSDISPEAFATFMHTGIPPRGSVLVSWQSLTKTELIPEAKLQLLDRALYVGDVVKRHSKDHMSGTVIGAVSFCTLFPSIKFNGGNLTPAMTEDLSVRSVPAQELINVHEFNEGAIVVYGDWVGRIEQVYDEVTVKLSNNSVVVAEDADDMDIEDHMLDRLSVGDMVKTRKGNLRRGRWTYGAFDPNIKPEGMVVETRPVSIDMQWLTRNIGASDGQDFEPPQRLYADEFNSPDFYVYDASASAASTLPLSRDGTKRCYMVAELTVGDRVRFKDIAGAAVKYDGSQTLPNGYPQGKVTRIPRTESLGYDMNVFIVMQTHTQVTVQWQDLSITEHVSPSLIPDPNVEDEDEVWPGEIIYTKEKSIEQSNADFTWAFVPAKVGVVQRVQSRDRLVTVRWFKNPTIRFLGEDLIPPLETGELSEGTEDVSLYDITSKPALTRRRGDFVLVHPGAIDPQALPEGLVGPNWFGEITDLGIDGKVTVRLGAAKPVVDVCVPVEMVTLAYSSDMDDQFMNTEMEGDSGDSEEYGDESEASDLESSLPDNARIEYEDMDGRPMEVGNEEEWSTEDEDEGSDVEMSDRVPNTTLELHTSNTTPELHSDTEKKSPTAPDANDPTSPTPSSPAAGDASRPHLALPARF